MNGIRGVKIKNRLKKSIPVIQSIPVHSGKRPPHIHIVLFELPLKGSSVRNHSGITTVSVDCTLSVRKSRRSIPAIHGLAAASQLGLRRQ